MNKEGEFWKLPMLEEGRRRDLIEMFKIKNSPNYIIFEFLIACLEKGITRDFIGKQLKLVT